MTLCRGNIRTFRLGHRAPFNNRSSYFAFLRTNYQASATAFLRAPSLISVALLVRVVIPSVVRMLPELVRQHQVNRWLFHQTWLCLPYCSIMGDISYVVFVDSHRIHVVFSFYAAFFIGILPTWYYVSSKFMKVQKFSRGCCTYRFDSTTSFGLCSKFNAQAAQKPYSTIGAGLVLWGRNSK
nr:hypothetical protein [Tanacetum cinerariifolium]